jgi:hypothetical protein
MADNHRIITSAARYFAWNITKDARIIQNVWKCKKWFTNYTWNSPKYLRIKMLLTSRTGQMDTEFSPPSSGIPVKRPMASANSFDTKITDKLSRYTPCWRLGGGRRRRYSCYSFLTSALDGVSGQRLSPGKRPPVPIVQEAGWAPEPVWTQGLE